jgi:hypothetical protein
MLMKGMFGTFRNPTAHAPKVLWATSRTDALDMLTLASMLHRRLDDESSSWQFSLYFSIRLIGRSSLLVLAVAHQVRHQHGHRGKLHRPAAFAMLAVIGRRHVSERPESPEMLGLRTPVDVLLARVRCRPSPARPGRAARAIRRYATS